MSIQILSIAGVILGQLLVPDPKLSDALDEYAQQIESKLHPHRRMCPSPSTLNEEFQSAICIAAEWPHPAFRSRLLELLNDDDTLVVVWAARGVANFDDKETIDALKRLTDDSRGVYGGCIVTPVGEHVTEAISTASARVGFPTTEGDDLPFVQSEHNMFPNIPQNYPRGMTIPLAIQANWHSRLSVRLRAFEWLIHRGIVINVEPLETAWASADESQRAALVLMFDRSDIHVGKEMARKAIERLVTQRIIDGYSEKTRSAMAIGLASLGSPRARNLARPIVLRAASTSYKAPKGYGRLTDDACSDFRAVVALSLVAKASDVKLAIEWTESPNEVVSEGAYCILARLNDEQAVRSVEARLARKEPLEQWNFWTMRLLTAIRDQGKRHEAIKWRYLAAINDRMKQIAQEIIESGIREDRMIALELDGLIHTMEALTRITNGCDSFESPGFNPDRAIQTSRRWDAWISENKPK